ncbi:PTS sugar transporter subunit IIA [Terrisporobacter sp.]|uniref:PTS sugar transporter subunit IIA n=1 Tax=Terrisporobacter sp. TaxID=1965305 RepID=UPI00263151AD|nr:PTS glucose transporter subunit IIA [Terrisporobacter sp.]
MLSIFKKKKNNSLTAFSTGKVIPIDQVNDEVFSSKMLGDGIAIRPENNEVVAPCDAEVTMIMEESKHAIGLKLVNGMELLFHIGIDTVSMNGEGFNIFVKSGDTVNSGDKLISFDRSLIKEKGLDDIVIMAITNSDEYKSIKYKVDIQAVSNDTVIATF